MWDPYKAVKYAQLHANLHSHGLCAHYVTDAIRHGGINISTTHYAMDMGYNLTLTGFSQNYGEPEEGDVAVIQPIAGHPFGHTCIYDGHRWISDFLQRTMYPGQSYRDAAPHYVIYHHN